MKFLDRFRTHRLKQFSGTYDFQMELFYDGKDNIIEVRWTYHGTRNTFDVDFCAVRGTEVDVWDRLSPYQCYSIDSKIREQIYEWSRRVGIQHPYSN